MAKLTKASLSLLAAICAAQIANTVFYASDNDLKQLKDAGKVDIHPTATDPANPANHAVRATAEALAEYQASQSTPASNTTTVAPTAFKLVSGVPIPSVKRRGGKGAAVYPFEQMEVGQSFFIAATAEKPNPAKSLTSTTASATRRFATPNGEREIERKGVKKMVKAYTPTKVFEVRAIEDGTPWGATGKGAAVYRTA